MSTFVFDIETIPDIAGARRLYDLGGLNDSDAANALFQMRRQETQGSDFLRLHLQRIVTISVVLRHQDKFAVWSLGDENATEQELLERFFDGIDKYCPTIVSWNGSNFDLPVIHYRALLHGISAPRYWETGDLDNNFRWNNYLNRFHYRHTDLMDILAGYQPRANAPLDEIATLLGLPGKMGMHGSLVWQEFQLGNLSAIRNYCETDVLNTYLVYLRFELMRGKLSQQQYQTECEVVKNHLFKSQKPHLLAFLQAWQHS